MISFESDYNNGAHPKVLQHLIETNEEKTLSYGFDVYCDSAKEKIKAACEDPDAEIFFLAGGTQTNATVIDSILHTYEGVVSVERSEEHTSELQSRQYLVCRLLLEKKKKKINKTYYIQTNSNFIRQ